jgi:hypothetical protein
MPVRRTPRWGLSRRESRSHPLNDTELLAHYGHDIDIDAEQPRQCRCHRSDRRVTYRNQAWLSLTHDVVALVIPALLAARVSVLLAAWRCLPPVLVHPEVREHWFVLAGERFGVVLPWPLGVHHFTGGHLLLPPAVTPGGLVTWVAPPLSDALRLCREVDVFAAVRTALRELRPGGPPSGGGLLI